MKWTSVIKMTIPFFQGDFKWSNYLAKFIETAIVPSSLTLIHFSTKESSAVILVADRVTLDYNTRWVMQINTYKAKIAH